MIDATTQQQKPCPICDSTNVRWRGRRIYDAPLTWARAAFESVGSMMFGSSRSNVPVDAHGYADLVANARRLRAEKLEARTGLCTPTAFWRCRDCRNRGYVFEPRAKEDAAAGR
jgi:rubrerythrin